MISNFPSPGLAFGKRKEAEDGDGGGEGGFSAAQQKENNERRQKQVSRLTSPFLQPVDTSGVGWGGGEVEVEVEGSSFRLPETGLKSISANRRWRKDEFCSQRK